MPERSMMAPDNVGILARAWQRMWPGPHPASEPSTAAGELHNVLSVEPTKYGLPLAFVLLSSLFFVALAPFAGTPLPQVWAFIPIYQSALVICSLITATLLFVQSISLRSRALVVLAGGYLFTAGMIIAHSLSFPGLFAPAGLLGSGPQTTVWLSMFWHAGFPIAVLAYALLKSRATATEFSVPLAVLSSVFAVAVATVGLTLLTTAGHDLLPAIMQGNSYTSSVVVVTATVLLTTFVALFALWVRRPHWSLDLWLMAVMCAWLLDVALSAGLNSGRFDLGFYAGRTYGLLAASFVLIMLLLETGTLHSRLLHWLRTESREQERRLHKARSELLDLSHARRRGREQARERFRLALEACPTGVVMIDSEGRIMLVNDETARLFGYGRGEMIGRPVEMLLPTRLRRQHVEHRNEFGDRPEKRRMGVGIDLYGVRKDGSEFPVEVSLNPIDTQEGRCVLGVIADVSERRRVDKLKDEFVSTVSHELRTPLTSISASLGLLNSDQYAALPAAAKRLLTIAHSNCYRLVRLVNDFLDIQKIESGNVVFNLRRVTLRPLVEQTIDANRALADSLGVRLLLDQRTEHDVRADSDRLMQVITNLLSNAIKFSPRDSEVEVSVAQRGDNVRIGVRDHGPGIPKEFRARVFEKFAQADGTDARQKGGTGLGLSIVKQVMLRLGGEVGFMDAPGGGTIFYAELPRLEPINSAELATGARILVCEDDIDVAEVICERLSRLGFAADLAQTVAGALTQAAETTYCAFLVDLQLPDGDGISLIQQLRVQPLYRTTPIVVVSANPGQGREDLRSSDLDVLDWLAKPFDISRLLEALRPAIMRNGGERLRVLHLDDDADMLAVISQVLDSDAEVVSVRTLEQARSALATGRFDLAVVDLALDGVSGLDLLPELHDVDGETVPVIVYSAQAANRDCAAKVQAILAKSRASIDDLVATLGKRLTGGTPPAAEKRALG